jgi:hypothetical protein
VNVLSKQVLGMMVGAILGAIDGLSAWPSPEARPMILAIVVRSTLKGVLTGLLAGLIARWRRSTALGVGAGLAIGFALSSFAAVGQPAHYWEIVLPGMLIGAMVGFVTQRYPLASSSGSTGKAVALAIVAALPLAFTPAFAQQPVPTDPLMPLAGLVGRWSGTSEGQPGSGTVEREYERVFGTRFIRARNTSTYPPQAKNPKGEVHHDEGWFSFDTRRKRIIFRQFHVEGFVTQYVEDGTSTVQAATFTSEAIENIPTGYRARETYLMHGPDDLEEVFEMAEPGKGFEVYSRTRLKRVR